MKHSGDGQGTTGVAENRRIGVLRPKQHLLSCCIPQGVKAKRLMRNINLKMHVSKKDESHQLDKFCMNLCSMIIESRVPCQSDKGYCEGPHCSLMSELKKHRCNPSLPECAKYKSYIDRLLSAEDYPFFQIEVFLLPKCCQRERGLTLPPNIKKKEYVLLERWTLAYHHSRSTKVAMSSDQLLRAVRSSLHFSQLSAWLSVTKGGPLNLFYWIKLPEEAFDTKFDSMPEVHAFPSWKISDNLHAYVTVTYRPRAQSLPLIPCTSHDYWYQQAQPNILKSVSMCSTSSMEENMFFSNKVIQVNSRSDDTSLHFFSSNSSNPKEVTKESKSHSFSSSERSSIDFASSSSKTIEKRTCKKRKSQSQLDKSKFKVRLLCAEARNFFTLSCSSASKKDCDNYQSHCTLFNTCDQTPVIQAAASEVSVPIASLDNMSKSCSETDAIGQSELLPSDQNENDSKEMPRTNCENSCALRLNQCPGNFSLSTRPVQREMTCISKYHSAQKVSLPSQNARYSVNGRRSLFQLKDSEPTYINFHKGKRLLANFEEAILQGCFPPSKIVPGFKVEIGASGSFRPDHLTLPVDVKFCELGNQSGASPYLGHVILPEANYYVPKKGALQVTLFNPTGNVVKMFILNYDLANMPPLCHTFMRQRTFFMPIEAKASAPSRKYLCYIIHIRFASSKAGRIYLRENIKIMSMNNSSNDAVSEEPHEFQSFIEMPSNPVYTNL